MSLEIGISALGSALKTPSIDVAFSTVRSRVSEVMLILSRPSVDVYDWFPPMFITLSMFVTDSIRSLNCHYRLCPIDTFYLTVQDDRLVKQHCLDKQFKQQQDAQMMCDRCKFFENVFNIVHKLVR